MNPKIGPWKFSTFLHTFINNLIHIKTLPRALFLWCLGAIFSLVLLGAEGLAQLLLQKEHPVPQTHHMDPLAFQQHMLSRWLLVCQRCWLLLLCVQRQSVFSSNNIWETQPRWQRWEQMRTTQTPDTWWQHLGLDKEWGDQEASMHSMILGWPPFVSLLNRSIGWIPSRNHYSQHCNQGLSCSILKMCPSPLDSGCKQFAPLWWTHPLQTTYDYWQWLISCC